MLLDSLYHDTACFPHILERGWMSKHIVEIGFLISAQSLGNEVSSPFKGPFSAKHQSRGPIRRHFFSNCGIIFKMDENQYFFFLVDFFCIQGTRFSRLESPTATGRERFRRFKKKCCSILQHFRRFQNSKW